MKSTNYGAICVNSTFEAQPNTSSSKSEERLHLLDAEYQQEGLSVPLEEPENPREEPIFNRTLEHPTSNFDTMVHLLKANIGTGILAMPDAFRNSGWVMGLFGTLFMGFICTHCMHMLVKCSHELCRRTQKPSLTFPEVIESSFKTGPRFLQKYSRCAKSLINVFLCTTQLGFCCVYYVFVVVNVDAVARQNNVEINIGWYFFALLVPMIGLNFIKSLKCLTPLSLCASLATAFSLGVTFFYLIQGGLPNTSTIKAFSSWEQLPLYFGTVIYAFEGIGVILPLENNMKNPEDFGRWNGVLNTGMVIVAVSYTAIGFFGYLKYGEKAVLGSITLLLPSDTVMAQSVRLMMALSIYLSYGIQFYVPFNIIWPSMQNYFETETTRKRGEYAARVILVVITFVFAITIPNLGAFISLVGAFSSSALALIFPPFIEIITLWPEKLGHMNWILWKDILIICFGFIGFVIGTYTSFLNIIK